MKKSSIGTISALLMNRFPFLSRIYLKHDNTIEPLPSYLSLLLAVMLSPFESPVCFVLPRRGELARIIAVLHGMTCFAMHYEKLAFEYTKKNFKINQRVRVNPSGHVYNFGGLAENYNGFFWLCPLEGSSNWKKSFPVSEIVRLEPTDRKRPIGKLNTNLLAPEMAPIDYLLDIRTYGNQGLMDNETLLLDVQSEFKNFVETSVLFSSTKKDMQSLSLLGDACTSTPSIKGLLSFGEIRQPDNGKGNWLVKWNELNIEGEPLVAVTYSPEIISDYCYFIKAQSKLIVINGLSRIKSLQFFDDMAQSQKIILFADHDEEKMIADLGNRGCRFWWLTGEELLGDGKEEFYNRGTFGSVAQWTMNYDQLILEAEPCDNPKLDEVFLRLCKMNKSENGSNDGSFTRLISRIWRMFNDACTLFITPADEERRQAIRNIDEITTDLLRNSAWFPPDILNDLKEAAEILRECYSSGTDLGISKGAALKRVVEEAQDKRLRVAWLVRNENRVNVLREWFESAGYITEQLFSPRTLPDDDFFDKVIFLSWPTGDTMQKVASKLVAPKITLIGYQCERHWLKQCRNRLCRHPHTASLTRAEKNKLLCVESDILPADYYDNAPVLDPPPKEHDFDIWSFESKIRSARIGLAARPTDATETVPAHYIRFSGDYYAFLTETHKLPVATDLVSNRKNTVQRLPERTIFDIRTGDFIVFPGSGDRELLHEVADRLLGSEAMELRRTAHLWKEALLASKMTPDQFARKARYYKRPRHIMTIRNWFADSSQIGPREKEDLRLIAYITENELLDRNIDEVRAAIERLWGAHQSAGVQVRDRLLGLLPGVVDQVEENGTQIDLEELGSAWIVHVESIAQSAEPRGRSEVNRLFVERMNH